MKTKRILMQTACAVIAAVLLCGCAVEPNELETSLSTSSGTDLTTTAETDAVVTSETTETTESESITIVSEDSDAEMSVEDIIASYGEWYLSPITYTEELKAAKNAEEYQKWSVETPGKVTVTRGDLEITADFFKEIYRFGEGMQIRFTVRNTSSEPFRYRQGPLGCFVNHQSSGLLAPHTFFREEQKQYSEQTIQEIPGNGEVVYEYLYVVNCGTFSRCENWTVQFTAIRSLDEDKMWDYLWEIPLEVMVEGGWPSYPAPESYGEWFLSPITVSDGLRVIDTPVEYEKWILKTPGTVTEVHGSFEYTIEFFKEAYRFGEGLQVRATVKNITEETAYYGYQPAGCLLNSSSGARSPVHFRTDQGSYKTLNVTPIETQPQETLTYEYLFYVDYSYFNKEGIYDFHFEAVQIPLEVIAN